MEHVQVNFDRIGEAYDGRASRSPCIWLSLHPLSVNITGAAKELFSITRPCAQVPFKKRQDACPVHAKATECFEHPTCSIAKTTAIVSTLHVTSTNYSFAKEEEIAFPRQSSHCHFSINSIFFARDEKDRSATMAR